MLTCQEVTKLVTEYIDGELPVMARLRFLMHLSMCRHCRRYLRQMRAVVAAMGRLPDTYDAPPPPVEEALLRAFRNWPRGAG